MTITKSQLTRLLAVLATVMTLSITGLFSALPASAQGDDVYAGRFVTGVGRDLEGQGMLLSAVEAPGNVDQNYPAWCIQMYAPNPTKANTATVSTLTAPLVTAPADLRMTTAQAAWVLSKYQANPDPNSRAAIAYLIHANFERGSTGYMDAQANVNLLVKQVKAQLPEVHALAAKYVTAARASAVKGYKAGTVEGDGKRVGNIHGIGVLNEYGWLAGTPITITLNGPAVFTINGKKTWSGTSKNEPIKLDWEATGNGKVTWNMVAKTTPRRTLSKYTVGGEIQDTVSYGNRPASDPEQVRTPGTTFEVIYDFQPIVRSNVPDKTVSVGDVLEDVLTVEADPNYGSGEWFKIPDSEDYIPVTFEGTAYLVGNLPVDKPIDTPADATVIGTASFVANGAGEYRAKLDKPAEKSGFVTWVWRMVKDNQAEEYVEYIHADFSDKYGVAEETTSVWHDSEIDSTMSVRETKSGTYLVDDLWITGMPDDHPNFAGNDRFVADVKEVTQKLLFFPEGLKVSDNNAAKAELIGEVTLPAKNGFYPSVGSTEFKMKLDKAGAQLPGTYVFVTSFAGDDRVKAMTTSVTDTTEQYVVSPKPLKVTTKAVPEITVGESAHDTAIVSGNVPKGTTLGFELYKAQGSQKTCTPQNLVFTSPAKPLPAAGEFKSNSVVLNEVGTYYWVETVRDSSGATLHRGQCGLPSETTKVKARDDDGDGASRLPNTGSAAGTFASIAGVLAGAGAGAVALRRRLTH